MTREQRNLALAGCGGFALGTSFFLVIWIAAFQPGEKPPAVTSSDRTFIEKTLPLINSRDPSIQVDTIEVIGRLATDPESAPLCLLLLDSVPLFYAGVENGLDHSIKLIYDAEFIEAILQAYLNLGDLAAESRHNFRTLWQICLQVRFAVITEDDEVLTENWRIISELAEELDHRQPYRVSTP